MNRLSTWSDPGLRRWIFAPAALGLLLWGCAPAEDAGGEESEAAAGEEAAMETAIAETTAAQDAPACQFTASGEELTGRASPPDSASVALGGETAKICYGSPSVRGREIMGGLVPYGQPWRMGANEPTTLHLPFAAEVGGVSVEPGSYALYAIPGESEWTIVLNSDPDRWGIPISEDVRAQDVGSFTVEPASLEQPVERMTIRLEQAEEAGAATFVLEWADTRVSFPVRRMES